MGPQCAVSRAYTSGSRPASAQRMATKNFTGSGVCGGATHLSFPPQDLQGAGGGLRGDAEPAGDVLHQPLRVQLDALRGRGTPDHQTVLLQVDLLLSGHPRKNGVTHHVPAEGSV